VTTVDAQVQSADEARSVAYWLFYRDTNAVPQLIAMGRYDDVVRRTAEAGGWRIVSSGWGDALTPVLDGPFDSLAELLDAVSDRYGILRRSSTARAG